MPCRYTKIRYIPTPFRHPPWPRTQGTGMNNTYWGYFALYLQFTLAFWGFKVSASLVVFGCFHGNMRGGWPPPSSRRFHGNHQNRPMRLKLCSECIVVDSRYSQTKWRTQFWCSQLLKRRILIARFVSYTGVRHELCYNFSKDHWLLTVTSIQTILGSFDGPLILFK